jgi:hypothetical protein
MLSSVVNLSELTTTLAQLSLLHIYVRTATEKLTKRILLSGPNLTIASYNAANSLVRFENKNIFIYFEKNALAYYSAGIVCSCKFKSRRIGSWTALRELIIGDFHLFLPKSGNFHEKSKPHFCINVCIRESKLSTFSEKIIIGPCT